MAREVQQQIKLPGGELNRLITDKNIASGHVDEQISYPDSLDVIVGMLLFGSLGGWVFYMILGNYSMYLELEGVVAVTDIIESQSGNHAIIAILDQLPMATVAVAVFSLIAIIFSATTYDSASYALASVATLFLKAGDDPARRHRVFWAFALGLLP